MECFVNKQYVDNIINKNVGIFILNFEMFQQKMKRKRDIILVIGFSLFLIQSLYMLRIYSNISKILYCACDNKICSQINRFCCWNFCRVFVTMYCGNNLGVKERESYMYSIYNIIPILTRVKKILLYNIIIYIYRYTQ